MRQQKIWLGLSLNFLLSFAACSHGPNVNVCVSAPSQGQFNCSLANGVTSVVPYASSGGYSVYPQQSAQAMLDYCAAKDEATTQAPQFTDCMSDIGDGGFSCASETCEISPNGGGIDCRAGVVSFVPYSSSLDYVAFSPSDTQTLLDYCNIDLGQ